MKKTELPWLPFPADMMFLFINSDRVWEQGSGMSENFIVGHTFGIFLANYFIIEDCRVGNKTQRLNHQLSADRKYSKMLAWD